MTALIVVCLNWLRLLMKADADGTTSGNLSRDCVLAILFGLFFITLLVILHLLFYSNC
jgi:hypothetical protein